MNDLAIWTNGESAVGPQVEVKTSEAGAAHLAAWAVDQQVVALHESGHAILCAVLNITVSSIDITGKNGGELRIGDREDIMPSTTTSSRMRDRMVTILGGLAAEIVIIGQPTSGASTDLHNATDLALDMFSSGMDETPGVPWVNLRAWGYGSREAPESLREAQGQSVVRALAVARERAMDMATTHQDTIKAFARIVLEQRQLGKREVAEALAAVGLR